MYDDDSGLYYMNARYQNPSIGRFISQDPVHLAVGNRAAVERMTGGSFEVHLADPQSLNSYSYARNNPLKHVDVTGEYWETVVDLIALGLSAYDFSRERSFVNGLFLGLDTAGTILPVPAVAGYIKNGARGYKIAKYFHRVANNANDIVNLGGLFAKNATFKFTGKAWSQGEAGNDVASLVGHFYKHGDEVGAVDVGDYYNRANDLINSVDNKTIFKVDGVRPGTTDIVDTNTRNIVGINQSGEISTFHNVTDNQKWNRTQGKISDN
ncbi:MAG: RHS repeat-associated core domain-containing protein [Patescibacteria group bacterium]